MGGGREIGKEVGGRERQQGLTSLPLCISPTPARRSADRRGCAGAPACSCGIGPQRLLRTRASPAEGSGSPGCPRWAGSTGDAGWISRPCSHTRPKVSEQSTQNTLALRHSRQDSIDCIRSMKTLALTSALCCSSPPYIKCRHSALSETESFNFRLQPWQALLPPWHDLSSWIAQIPALKSKITLEETGICNGPVLLRWIFQTK